jgi:uncharacterized membrane protein YhaH (DUF805 family)
MSFTDAIRTCFSKYATFDGRATRAEFWWFYLFIIIVSAIGYVPFLILAALSSGDGAVSTLFSILSILWMILWIVVMIALIVPQLAVGCRRLHDRGQSGWLQLLLLVPCGNIVLIVFWVLEGTPGDNAYGPKPA